MGLSRYCRAGGYPPYTHGSTSSSPPHIPTQSTNHLHLGHRRSTGGCLLVGHRYFRLRTYVRLWGWAQRGSNPGLRKFVCGASARQVQNRNCGRDNSILNVRNRDEFNQIAANSIANCGKLNCGNSACVYWQRRRHLFRQYGQPRITAESSNCNSN